MAKFDRSHLTEAQVRYLLFSQNLAEFILAFGPFHDLENWPDAKVAIDRKAFQKSAKTGAHLCIGTGQFVFVGHPLPLIWFVQNVR